MVHPYLKKQELSTQNIFHSMGKQTLKTEDPYKEIKFKKYLSPLRYCKPCIYKIFLRIFIFLDSDAEVFYRKTAIFWTTIKKF